MTLCIRNISEFYQNLAIPTSCYIGKEIYKNTFFEGKKISIADQKAITEDIESILWKFTLSNSTMNMTQFVNAPHQFIEILIYQVTLRDFKKFKRIALAMQNSINCPLLILFVQENFLAISTAYKRNNTKIDCKLVEKVFNTEILNISDPANNQDKFLEDFCLNNFYFKNLFELFQNMVCRIIAFNCAAHTGMYEIPDSGIKSNDLRIELLEQIEKLQKERGVIQSKMRRVRNLGNRVHLNSQFKELSEQIRTVRDKI